MLSPATDGHLRHTKIIATLGPASSHVETIHALIAAGVNVFRLNFSHGSREEHRATMAAIRIAETHAGRPIAILQDLSGPKIRTGLLQRGEPLALAPGDALDIRIGDGVGEAGVVWTTYEPLATAVRSGDQLLLDDGKIELVVVDARPDVISTRVVDGGLLGEHKGINAPNVVLPATSITAKDEADLRFGIAEGIDLAALSFVQSGADVARAREIATDAQRPALPLIAKLERPEAIQRLAEICGAADGLMVARGDLGLELPLEQVPQVQKEVLRVGREHGVPVIVATQVLESMRSESRPTRAEVSDAAGAVDAGADAIMLSGETAVGRYPIRSVEVLDAIIRNAEAVPPVWTLPTPSDERPDHLPALCDAGATLAGRAGVDAIFAITRTGRTPRLLSARRPRAPIYAVSGDETCARSLCLWWGVQPIVDSIEGDLDAIVVRIVTALRANGRLSTPATIAVVSTSPDLLRGDMNFVHLRRV